VYFVTQNPLDIPDSVLAQLGNRVQHALRAFTPRDQKAVKSAADTMRGNPGLDIGTAITELAVGEALISFLDSKGSPSVTQRVFVLPPCSQIGPITTAQRQALLADSLVAGVYEKAVDRESAYEKLKGRAEASAEAAGPAAGKAAEERGWAASKAKDLAYVKDLTKNGMTTGLASDEIRDGLNKIGDTMTEDWIKSAGPDGKAIIDAYRKK